MSLLKCPFVFLFLFITQFPFYSSWPVSLASEPDKNLKPVCPDPGTPLAPDGEPVALRPNTRLYRGLGGNRLVPVPNTPNTWTVVPPTQAHGDVLPTSFNFLEKDGTTFLIGKDGQKILGKDGTPIVLSKADTAKYDGYKLYTDTKSFKGGALYLTTDLATAKNYGDKYISMTADVATAYGYNLEPDAMRYSTRGGQGGKGGWVMIWADQSGPASTVSENLIVKLEDGKYVVQPPAKKAAVVGTIADVKVMADHVHDESVKGKLSTMNRDCKDFSKKTLIFSRPDSPKMKNFAAIANFTRPVSFSRVARVIPMSPLPKSNCASSLSNSMAIYDGFYLVMMTVSQENVLLQVELDNLNSSSFKEFAYKWAEKQDLIGRDELVNFDLGRGFAHYLFDDVDIKEALDEELKWDRLNLDREINNLPQLKREPVELKGGQLNPKALLIDRMAHQAFLYYIYGRFLQENSWEHPWKYYKRTKGFSEKYVSLDLRYKDPISKKVFYLENRNEDSKINERDFHSFTYEKGQVLSDDFYQTKKIEVPEVNFRDWKKESR